MTKEPELLGEFAQRLRTRFSGEIRTDRMSRLLYSTDASIYQIEPVGVVIPRTHDDVAATVELAVGFGIPVLSRGGGTSLAGQTVGTAVVVDYSKYMNRVLEIDAGRGIARIEPGVVLDQLNAAARPSGLQFGPDVATSNRATLGGMIGNNSCGARSVLYGKTIDHVRRLRIVAPATGELMLQELTPSRWKEKTITLGREGDIYRSVDRLVRENEEEIRRRFPSISRHVGGYNLNALLPGQPKNLCRIITGSEGTLAAFTEVEVGLVPLPRARGLSVAHFHDLPSALNSVPAILELGPAAIELIDRTLLEMTRSQPGYARLMDFVEGEPSALLIVEFYADSAAELDGRLEALDRNLRGPSRAFALVRATSPEQQAQVWAVRKAGLGLLTSVRGDTKPVAFVEDTAVPPGNLGEYVRRFSAILDRYGTRAGIYGHASVGCLHIRPFLNLKESEGVDRMLGIATEVKDLVREFGGAMSGEHGDGIVRGHWNRQIFGDQLYGAFRQLKAAFDPTGVMNPGKIVDCPPMTRNLRYRNPPAGTVEPATFFDFSLEGGLLRAVEQCSGLGACRKLGTGTMCPSYMATMEEEHSTRGRASALRAALSGQLPLADFDDQRMYEVMDLCLECKACKTECPAGVDMAKIKFEFLANYNRKRGVPLRSRVFANIALLSRIGSATAPVSNFVLGSAVFRHTIMRLLGVHPSRALPEFARETFLKWVRRNPPPRKEGAADAVLFTDTFMNFNEPSVGRATLRLLLSAGVNVHVPDVVCCGRSMISKGLLEQAREQARKNVAILAPYAATGAAIVGCEPSCLLTLRDEYPDLLGTGESRLVASRAMLVEEFLNERWDSGGWRPGFLGGRRQVLYHGHCHQKSLAGSGPALRVLRFAPQFEVQEIDSGCCGMAGAFGFEAEHYGISQTIGELRLFPAVRSAAPETEIVACGTSCRQQIRQGTGRQPRHIAELLADVITDPGRAEAEPAGR